MNISMRTVVYIVASYLICFVCRTLGLISHMDTCSGGLGIDGVYFKERRQLTTSTTGNRPVPRRGLDASSSYSSSSSSSSSGNN